MKVSIDDIELFTLSEIQKRVIQNDIPSDLFDEDMRRRLQYSVINKYECCFDRLKKEWEPKLAEAGVKNIPLDQDELAQLIFSQPDYKNRSTREADEKIRGEAQRSQPLSNSMSIYNIKL